MKLGFVGFGRMGGNMVTRLLQRGHTISVFARRPEVRAEVKAKGLVGDDRWFYIQDCMEKT